MVGLPIHYRTESMSQRAGFAEGNIVLQVEKERKIGVTDTSVFSLVNGQPDGWRERLVWNFNWFEATGAWLVTGPKMLTVARSVCTLETTSQRLAEPCGAEWSRVEREPGGWRKVYVRIECLVRPLIVT
ncbi:hypothetical protein B0H17DRAFT_1129144 [Mycena rosella]|uniref:Uncharacterized protein n=1 Tax=Mycena rosella TaxID=1033263 RepID=A0AAD7DTP8_MYCRO|nr:hypothetical protein B0H17DRAFT_1129144 [Mycena rosella]